MPLCSFFLTPPATWLVTLLSHVLAQRQRMRNWPNQKKFRSGEVFKEDSCLVPQHVRWQDCPQINAKRIFLYELQPYVTIKLLLMTTRTIRDLFFCGLKYSRYHGHVLLIFRSPSWIGRNETWTVLVSDGYTGEETRFHWYWKNRSCPWIAR